MQTAARARIAALGGNYAPSEGAVQLTITYYHEGSAPDADNVIKLIQDALNGIVYIDDDQIADVRSRRRDLDGMYRVRRARPEVMEAFAQGDEFVHVLIEGHADDGDLSK